MNGDPPGTIELLRVLRELSAGPGPRADLVANAVRDALDLDFAYVSLDARATPGALVKAARLATPETDIEQYIARWSGPGADAAEPESFQGLKVIVGAPGGDRPFGVLAAASGREGFPTEAERLFLEIVTNHLAGARPGPPAAPEAQRRFDALANSAPAMLWITQPGASCTFVSRLWQEFTGQPVAAALGVGWLEMLHPQDRAHVRQLLDAAHEHETPFAVDCRLRHFDGRYLWVANAGHPHFGEGSEFLGLVGAVVEIDDRKRAEAALRRTQQGARFLANVSVALAEISDSYSVLRKVASLAVPFFADWCAVDVVGEGGHVERLAVVHSEPGKASKVGEITNKWRPALEDTSGPGHVVRTGEPEMVEHVEDAAHVPWVRDAEHGRVLRELGLASYLCVPARWRLKTRAALTFARADPERPYDASDLRLAADLAQRASAAAENAELYRMAVAADRRKDEFLAVLSHELRTPLNAIVGWAHVLREGASGERPPAPELIRKAVDTIHRNAQMQTQLISDILDVSRIVAGKLRLDVRSVDLPVVIEAALDTIRPATNAKQVRIEAVLDPGAGPISGDPSRLQQIVWNLLSNAIRFVPSKSGRIHVRLEAINSHVRLVIEDNGPGIDPEFLPHIFDRFRQADSSHTRPHQGLGLGLAIVRHLVELHGGTVRAENREGRAGARFVIELPRRSVAAVSEGAERHPHDEEPVWLDTAPSLAGVRILVVDDEADARDLLKIVLERCGATVRLAASAQEALTMIVAEGPDVLLADIEMPDRNGYDLLRELRSRPSEQGGRTPAVALTAYATAHDRVKVLRAGFQMHIPKPVQPGELVTVIASLVPKP